MGRVLRSGHGVGKTAVLAWIIVWHIVTREPQKVLATAPTCQSGAFGDRWSADRSLQTWRAAA
ncbi:MAG TPA: hypothetical protein VNJ04_15420 [Gemmatimonadaceae bacterium]|nr:hypothetical protein [Gemmatimonadaceae bacterium]